MVGSPATSKQSFQPTGRLRRPGIAAGADRRRRRRRLGDGAVAVDDPERAEGLGRLDRRPGAPRRARARTRPRERWRRRRGRRPPPASLAPLGLDGRDQDPEQDQRPDEDEHELGDLLLGCGLPPPPRPAPRRAGASRERARRLPGIVRRNGPPVRGAGNVGAGAYRIANRSGSPGARGGDRGGRCGTSAILAMPIWSTERSPVASSAVSLEVGEIVVYGPEGFARVDGVEEREILGKAVEVVDLFVMDSNMRVSVPIDRALERGLRPVAAPRRPRARWRRWRRTSTRRSRGTATVAWSRTDMPRATWTPWSRSSRRCST